MTPMTRRNFGRGVAGTVGACAFPAACSGRRTAPTYEELVARTWRHANKAPRSGPDVLREIVRYATLAANSHNTQPWRFRIEAQRITVRPDFSRRCPAVDPDDHHLFVSLGCATENLVLAAEAHGYRASVSIDPADAAIRVDLESSSPSASELFHAIPKRQCTRADYNGQQVSSGQLDVLKAKAQDDGVAVQLFSDKADLEKVLEYVVAGNTVQMSDKAFVAELKDWIRFSEAAVVEYRDGLFAASSGNPVLPDWLGGWMFNFVFKADSENDRYRRHIRSSAGLFAFVSEHNKKESWIKVGRAYQRFALQATVFGLRHAHINQAVEVPEVRTQFADYLGIGDRRPDLLVRFGYGPELPRSLRRPVDRVTTTG